VEVRSALRRAWPDLAAGAIYVLIALVFVIQSLQYEIGSLLRMGAGFFPLMLGSALLVLGLAVGASGFVAEREQPVTGFPWRAIFLVAAALIIFPVIVRPLGLIPAVFLTTILAGLAGARPNPVMVVVIAAGLTVVVLVIFVLGLQLRLRLFGDLVGF
jgi:hypothetical protein